MSRSTVLAAARPGHAEALTGGGPAARSGRVVATPSVSGRGWMGSTSLATRALSTTPPGTATERPVR